LVNQTYIIDPAKIATRKRLRQDLEQLGLRAGDAVCVHSSCRNAGYIVGGPRTLLETLLDTVGPKGTLMMPTFTGDLSEPARWKFPAVPQDMLEEVRNSLPGFHRDRSPARKMGVLPELLRHEPCAVRSPHPQSSFTAVGPLAFELCGNHPLDFRFGPQSPLAALARHGGKVLMLGAPWNTASLFYLTEFETADRTECTMASPIATDLGVKWVNYRDLVYRNIAQKAVVHLVENGAASRGIVGCADSVFFEAEAALAETLTWRH
jgi:aminoglycoside 3-N-acetyltransferase